MNRAAQGSGASWLRKSRSPGLHAALNSFRFHPVLLQRKIGPNARRWTHTLVRRPECSSVPQIISVNPTDLLGVPPRVPFVSGHVPATPEGFPAAGSAVERTSRYPIYFPDFLACRRSGQAAAAPRQRELVCCRFHHGAVGFAVAGLDEREFNLRTKQETSIPPVTRGGLFSSSRLICLSSEPPPARAEPKGRANVSAPLTGPGPYCVN